MTTTFAQILFVTLGMCERIIKRQTYYYMSMNQKLEDLITRVTALENRKTLSDTTGLVTQIEKCLPLTDEECLRKFEKDLEDEDFFSCAVSIRF